MRFFIAVLEDGTKVLAAVERETKLYSLDGKEVEHLGHRFIENDVTPPKWWGKPADA